jgi:hypothetical protein
MDCSVCAMPFDFEERRPRILPCAHTFCSSCLARMVVSREHAAGSRAITCPHCRNIYGVLSAGVNALPCNFALQELMGKLPGSPGASFDPAANAALSLSGGEVIQCQQPNCGVTGPASHMCNDCGMVLCMPHGFSHASELGSLGHRVTACAEVMKMPTCPDHERQPVLQFCGSHNRAVCRLCRTGAHSACNLESFQVRAERRASVPVFARKRGVSTL